MRGLFKVSYPVLTHGIGFGLGVDLFSKTRLNNDLHCLKQGSQWSTLAITNHALVLLILHNGATLHSWTQIATNRIIY